MSEEPRVLSGRYRLLSVLGRGGMGQVWLAEDEVLGRRVAVKEIRFPSGLPADEREVQRERTLREARLTARLSHPGIITVYDVVSEDGSPYIVMELITAPSLAAAIDMEGSLPPERVAQIGLRLLDALDVAHAEGIVHRDVKPSNVLLDGDRVVLSDFGIATSASDATLTTTGMVVGSPTYMSPERLRSEGIGPGGDLWSLGATLYAALEGHPPFRAQNVMGTITAVLADPPEPPTVAGPLRDAVLGLLEKSPETRLGSQRARLLLEQALREPTTVPNDPHPSAELPVMAPAVEGAAGGWYAHPAPTSAPTTAPPTARTATPFTARSTTPSPAASQAPSPVPSPAASEAPSPVPSPAASQPPSPAASPAPSTAVSPAASTTLGALTPTDASGDGGGSVARPPRRSGRPSGRTLVAGLLILTLVLAVIAVVIVRSGSGGDDSGDPAGSSPGAGDSADTDDADAGGSGAPDVPAGFRLVHDPLDFTVAVPKGWERRLDGATRVDYVSPDGSRFLRVDQTADAGPDAEQAWLDAEPSVADSLPGYTRISIEPVDYRGWEAADWEFTWEGDSGTVRVLNRGFITDPRGFALYMSGPEGSWQDESLPVFEAAAATFEPSG